MKSKFLNNHKMLDKIENPYYNYYSNIIAPATPTHLIILSNGPSYDISYFLKK